MRDAGLEARVMPRGSRHDETGLLVDDHGRLSLSRDEGGTWRLNVPHGARRLAGQRVRVLGVRADFDLLDVERIEPVART